MSEEVCAMSWEEKVQSGTQAVDQGVESAGGGSAQMRFEFSESQFDGIEVGTVRREVEQLRSGAFDGRGDLCSLVRGEVVGNDQIAGLQSRRQALLDVGEEGRPIHGTIQQPGSGQLIMTQRGDEGGSLPVSMRHPIHAACAARGSSIKPHHLGVEAGFIEKDQPSRIPVRGALLPVPPLFLDISALLFGGVQHFFYMPGPWL